MNATRLSLFVSVVALTAACSASSRDEEQVAPIVEGVYRLEAADANVAIQEMEFRGSEYWLVPRGCASDGCKEHGSFAIHREKHALELVVAGSGRTYELPFEITSTKRAPHIDSNTPAPQAGQLSPAAESLVKGGQELVVGQSQLTVGSIKLVETSYTLASDDCGGRDMVTIAKAMCSNFKVPTKSPRIQCIVMNDQDSCNGASMQSCLQNTSDNDALARYDSYNKACKNAGDVALETRGSMNYGLNPYVMTVCCANYTCAGGATIDGTSVTGKAGQTVCGQSGTKWWCGPGGKEEGVGEWQNLGTPCSR